MKVYRRRKSSYVYKVKVAGEWFEAWDLLNTCHEILWGSDIYLTDERMIKALKKANVLSHPGSGRNCMRATGTKKLEGFAKRLNKALDADRCTTLKAKEYSELK